MPIPKPCEKFKSRTDKESIFCEECNNIEIAHDKSTPEYKIECVRAGVAMAYANAESDDDFAKLTAIAVSPYDGEELATMVLVLINQNNDLHGRMALITQVSAILDIATDREAPEIIIDARVLNETINDTLTEIADALEDQFNGK